MFGRLRRAFPDLHAYDEIFILRFVNGRIAETWGVVDVLSQMRQLARCPEAPRDPAVEPTLHARTASAAALASLTSTT
jgi:hypothetical protein